MKKFISILLTILIVTALFVSCGQPADTTTPDVTDAPVTDAPVTDAPVTDAPVTDAPVTDAPVTDAPVTDAPVTDAPVTDAPVTDAPVTDDNSEAPDAEDEADQKNLIFDYDFSNSTSSGAAINENFPLQFTNWQRVSDEVGYLTNTSYNGNIFIKDNDLALVGKNFMFEAEVTFDVLPYKAEGVTNFPLSAMTWTRTTSAGDTYYDWAFKLDDEGYIYIKDTSTRTDVKIEANKKYTIGVLFDDENTLLTVYLDGIIVGSKSYSDQTLTESSLRLFDSGSNKAHFTVKLHTARAYFPDETK